MGTRSLTHVVEDNDTLLTIYRQYDGYLSGHGLDLAEYLHDISIVNGMNGDNKAKANGMGCLSAQLLAYLKKEPGNIYVYPADSKDCWEEFTYYIYNEKVGEGVKIKVKDAHNKTIFNGTPGELINKVNEQL